MKIISNKQGIMMSMNTDEYITLRDLVIKGAMSTSLCGLVEEDIKKKNIFDLFKLTNIT